ncbi:unnamed protein product [Microthlaspi erraticum]|uniref:Uncharacterized protein n=1 Tax=Microthlaspi erraticum TaxID=1685480 RepID=A0A6D2KAN3_9BRAS|nr:unnamed protein product [Microthlaspi erraticum]
MDVVVSSATALPNDVLLNCLARVPRRYDPILACVSKTFRSLVLSPDELPQVRYLMGKNDYPVLYVRFSVGYRLKVFHWLTFNLNEKIPSDQDIRLPFLTTPLLSGSTVSIGSDIYFIGAAGVFPGLYRFDSLSGKLWRGPLMKAGRRYPGVAVVDGKIYALGGCLYDDRLLVEVFDLETQTWEFAPLSPHGEDRYGTGSMRTGREMSETVAVDGKIYVMGYLEGIHVVYNTKDGTSETFEMADETWNRGGACVIDSVIYVYYFGLGLMWYDSKEKVWRVVQGLKIDESIERVGLVDCDGKLAILWGDCSNGSGDTNKKIWCKMVVLDRSEVAIHGKVDWSDSLGSVPANYDIWHCTCLGISD